MLRPSSVEDSKMAGCTGKDLALADTDRPDVLLGVELALFVIDETATHVAA